MSDVAIEISQADLVNARAATGEGASNREAVAEMVNELEGELETREVWLPWPRNSAVSVIGWT